MTDYRNTSKRSCGPNHKTSLLSQNGVINRLAMLFVVFAIAACSQNNAAPTPADRVKLVEDVQKTDPNFHVPRQPKTLSENKSGAVAEKLLSDAERTASAPNANGAEMVRLR